MKVYLRDNVYWVRFAADRKDIRRSLRTTDKRVAMQRAVEYVAREQRRALGLGDGLEEQSRRPVDAHVSDFRAALTARGASDEHVRDRDRCLRMFLAFAGPRRLADLDVAKAAAWLTSLRDNGLAARGVNRRCQALKQFGRWLLANRRATFDPFASLRLLAEKLDRRHVRRSLTVDEFQRLLQAALDRPLAAAATQRVNAGVSEPERLRLTRLGEVRRLAYVLAVTTGLRTGELQRLRWCDVDLTNRLARIPATSAKSRKEQTVSLHPTAIDLLKLFRRPEQPVTATVIPRGQFPNRITFGKDLAAAGIPVKDEQGQVLDRHALRTTFVTWLQVAGAHPHVAQLAARHAKVETTLARYTDSAHFDVRAAVDRLPVPASGPPAEPPSA